MGQAGQSGFRARQVFRPWSTSRKLKSSQSFAGNDRHEVPLDLLRVRLPAQPEPAGEAADVGVHGDPLGLAVARRKDDVGRLAGDARKRHQVRHGVGDLAAVDLDDALRGAR